jgi:non-homologous end joining protein Ku
VIRKKAKAGTKAMLEEEEEEKEAAPPKAEVVDLMALLKESVSGKSRGSKAKRPTAAKTASPAKAAAETARARPKRATGSSRSKGRRAG